MALYHYKAKSRKAETITGTIAADNQKEAVEKINQLNLMPISVQEAGASLKSAQPLRITTKQLYIFTRQLTNLLRAGVPILRALDIMAEQTKHTKFRKVIEAVHYGIREGRNFSDCLSDYPRLFSPLYVSMVRAGEEGGNLKETMSDLSVYLHHQLEMIAKVKSALVYPFIMLLFGIGTVCFILTRVLPQLTDLFVNLNQTLPLPTRLVMSVSELLKDFWLILLVGLFFLVVFIKIWATTASGQRTIGTIKLKTPWLNEFWLQVELARFCRTLHLLLKSGVSVVRALQLSIPVIGNILIQEQLKNCYDQLVAGKSLSEGLRQSRWLPPVFGQMIAIGEESGYLGETIHDIAENYELQTHETIKVMTTLLEPLLIVFIGGLLGVIIIAMLLPIFELDVFGR